MGALAVTGYPASVSPHEGGEEMARRGRGTKRSKSRSFKLQILEEALRAAGS